MVKTITPFSTRAKEGATDSPLGDFVNVEQAIVSTADVGFYDQNTGKLTGVQASDKLFGQIQLASAVANGAYDLSPSANADGTWPLDMTGFTDVQIAIKTNNAGNYAIEAVMGPDTISNGGLSPVHAASALWGAGIFGNDLAYRFRDTAQALTADVWNIFYIEGRLQNQKLLQFKITNNSGGDANIESAFLRIV